MAGTWMYGFLMILLFYFAVAGDSGVTVEQETTPPPPPASGYAMAERMQAEDSAADTERSAARKNNKEAGTLKRPKIRANRMSSSTSVPTPEQLTAIKHRKKVGCAIYMV